MNSVIARASAGSKENKALNHLFKRETNSKPLFKHIAKKSAVSIKQDIRNDTLARLSNKTEVRLSDRVRGSPLDHNLIKEELESIKREL